MLSAHGAAPSYLLTVPPSVAGASQRHFDLHNATVDHLLQLLGLWAVPQSDVAVTGVLSWRLDTHITSAAGTGGTAATYKGTVTTAATINPVDPRAAALPTGLTARSRPTGGAASVGWLFPSYVFTEETAPGTHLMQGVNLLFEPEGAAPFVFPPGNGLLVQQGSVASVGSVAFLALFSVIPLA